MKRKHAKTLAAIFSRPTPGSIPWGDIESLFRALGAEIQEREGSRIAVVLFGEVRVFHRPHPSPDTYRQGCGGQHPQVVGRERRDPVNNIMIIDGYRAVIQYDPDIEMFRGEFTGLNGGADFYADSVAKLREEGRVSLRVFLEECRERGIEPTKSYSGKFQVRLPEELHKNAVDAAMAKGQSLNQFVATAIEHELSA